LIKKIEMVVADWRCAGAKVVALLHSFRNRQAKRGETSNSILVVPTTVFLRGEQMVFLKGEQMVFLRGEQMKP
jgi:hypothetical protein